MTEQNHSETRRTSAALRPTAGPWHTDYRKTARGGYAQEVFDANGEVIATLAWYPVKVSDTTTATNREANALLIAEAGTVLHETGQPPRRLAEQKSELLAIAKRARRALAWASDKHVEMLHEYEWLDAALRQMGADE